MAVQGDSDAARPRRHWFLAAAAIAANVYLVGFATDATLSVSDDLMRGAGLAGIIGVRNLVALLVVYASYVMAAGLVFIPQLPKRVLLPPVLFALWCDFGSLPFSILYPDDPLFDIAISASQLVLAIIAFAIIRLETEHTFLSAERLPRKTRVPWRIAGNVAAAILFVPLAFGLILITTIGALIEVETQHYIEFGLTAINAKETTLSDGHRTVRLIGMAHVGEPAFYRSLIDSLPADSVVLAEGIKDRDERLEKRLSYQNTARALGLVQQPSLGRELEDSLPETEETKTRDHGSHKGHPTVLNSDLDLSDFSPDTIRFLTRATDLYASKSLSETLSRMGSFQEGFGPKDYIAVTRDILRKRNRHLLETFDKVAPFYRTIIIAWGAEHMPEIEAGLRKRGYHIVSHDMRRIAGYATIVSGLLHRRNQTGG